jgi:hypothetical protein
MSVAPTAGTVGLTPLVPAMPAGASPSAVPSSTTSLFPCLTGGGATSSGC